MVKIIEYLKRRNAPTIDPFVTLEVQDRLSRLAHELRQLESSPGRTFARAHHVHAALWAYERTLEDALKLSRLPVPERGGAAFRVVAEAELMQAGWSW